MERIQCLALIVRHTMVKTHVAIDPSSKVEWTYS